MRWRRRVEALRRLPLPEATASLLRGDFGVRLRALRGVPMKRARITVTWDKREQRWVVRLAGFSPVSAKRKTDAVVIGIEAAKTHAPSELVIHLKDGTIQDARSYGSDPRRSRG